MIVKSVKQRQREDARKEDREKREAAQAKAEAEREVVIVHDANGDVRTVSAESLLKPLPAPPFKLTGKQRRELLDGDLPRIAFPKDKPCPITVGEVYPVTSQFAFVVVGIGESKEERLLHYQPLDHRPRHLGKAGDYSSSDVAAIATKKGVEEAPLSGPQFRPEKEQEPVSRREQSKMTKEDRAERLKRMRGNLKILQDNLGRLERLDEASDVCWGVRRSIAALKGRIERESRAHKESGSPVAA